MKTRRAIGSTRWAALTFASAIFISACYAQPSEDNLARLINSYRSLPQRCEGEQIAAPGPLAPNPLLAAIQIAPGAELRDALKDAGYLAGRIQVIMVSGPGDPRSAMNFIAQRYCRVLLSAEYAEIGISRSANNWRIVLAQPLLGKDLVESRLAGAEVLKLVNAARAEPRNCGNRQFRVARPLVWNDKLAAAALAHSRDMADRNDFQHKGQGGTQVSNRAEREGYAWRTIGENIATGQASPQQVVAGWLTSASHCANIMSPGFSEMGAAYAVNRNSDTGIYWTQVFGTAR